MSTADASRRRLPISVRGVRRPSAPTLYGLLFGTVMVLAITTPLYLTKRSFGPDWTDAMFLAWHQGVAIANTGHPTLYLLAQDRGLFEPFYAFYGGPLYGGIGAVSALLGNRPELAFVGANVALVGLAYAGMVWLGRELGGGRIARHVGAAVFVSSPYYLTDVYARGAFAETAALSALPLLLASGIALLRRPWNARTVLAFALAVVVLSGSHNLTLAWGTAVIVVIGAVLIAVLPAERRPPWRRVVALFGFAVLAMGVNSWALLINVLYSGKVAIAGGAPTDWHGSKAFNVPSVVFDPWRRAVPFSATPRLTVASQIWALVWAIVVAVLARHRIARAPQALRRTALVLVGGLVALYVLVLMAWPWDIMPKPLNLIQFPYRINGYIAIVVAALVPLTARLASGTDGDAVPSARLRRPGLLAASLGLLAAVAFVPGVLQAWDKANDEHAWSVKPDREALFAQGPGVVPKPSFYDPGSYRDNSEPVIRVPASRHIDLPMPEPGANGTSAILRLPRGDAPISTNVVGGPYVVSINGVRRIGRTATNEVVVAPPRDHRGPVRITVTARGGSINAARWGLSLLCLLAVIGVAVWVSPARPAGLRARRSAAVAR